MSRSQQTQDSDDEACKKNKIGVKLPVSYLIIVVGSPGRRRREGRCSMTRTPPRRVGIKIDREDTRLEKGYGPIALMLQPRKRRESVLELKGGRFTA